MLIQFPISPFPLSRKREACYILIYSTVVLHSVAYTVLLYYRVYKQQYSMVQQQWWIQPKEGRWVSVAVVAGSSRSSTWTSPSLWPYSTVQYAYTVVSIQHIHTTYHWIYTTHRLTSSTTLLAPFRLPPAAALRRAVSVSSSKSLSSCSAKPTWSTSRRMSSIARLKRTRPSLRRCSSYRQGIESEYVLL